jgi:glycerol-3-phosphate dehydrogenase
MIPPAFDLTAARCRVIDRMRRDGPLDVLVIGGGIVGAGVARDAAMRGLRTAVVDRFDFAFGTSSRSSRLLHGGLRYLAQGRIGLVREASREKVILAQIAPHLAVPLPFIFPTRRGTQWKKWKLSVGVKVYDLLCGAGKNLGKSSRMSVDDVHAALPQLSTENLTGAVRYFDGMTSDARLVLDSLRSAHAAGAALINYAPVERAHRQGEHWRCELTDAPAEAAFDVSARCVVNATGAWADKFPASGVKLRLTKGVHLVIDRDRLNIPDAVVMSAGDRILFAIPWGQRVILGTTDTDYDGPTDSPTCAPQDVAYILDVANANFTAAKLTVDDVISTWAGLRPLIGGGDNERGKPSDISRAHQIKMTQPGWFDVAGGKLTTYRLMAEQTVDRVVDFAGIDAKPCATTTTPLLAKTRTNPIFISGILPPDVSRDAVEHFIRNEWAVHICDIMIRRTSWRYYHRDHAAIAAQVAGWMAELLGWSEGRAQAELATYNHMLKAGTCGATTRNPMRRDEQVQPA